MKPAPKPQARAGTPAKPVKSPKPKADLALSLIVLVYSVIMIITPDMQAFDSNGPKFLVLAILNLAAYSYLLTRREFRTQVDEHSRFFLHPSGLSYLIFLVLCMLSVAKAINASEWVIQMCVTFTIFTSVYILFLVFRKGTVYFRMAAFALAVILLADCATVFYHIGQFVRGQFPTIFEIKSIYANKNILSAAIFVKLPVALWLSLYSTDRLRFLGQVALFCGLLAVLFLSTRAFYLGIMLLTLFYLAFLAWKWYRSREKKYLALAISYVIILAAAAGTYTFIQGSFYPKSNNPYTFSLAKRVGSIASDTAGSARPQTWMNSFLLLRENPLLGVGHGNWKVTELKYENPKLGDFTLMVKNHNDFIEMAAETGFVGGLAYLCIFLFPFLGFLRSLGRKEEDPLQPWLFIAAAGLMCYSVDAFFNFPGDRPEMTILFSIYLAAGIAYSGPFRKPMTPAPGTLRWLRVLFIAAMVVPLYFLYQNVISLRYQYIAQKEIMYGRLEHRSDYMIAGFPRIPDVASIGEPIAVMKARYLLNEEQYDRAIAMMMPDHSSPYDGRKDYFLAMAYDRKQMTDSALVHWKKVHELKPLLVKVVVRLSEIMAARDSMEQAKRYLDDYLAAARYEPLAWVIRAQLSQQEGDLAGAMAVTDSARKYLPADTSIAKKRAELAYLQRVTPHLEEYNSGIGYFNNKEWQKAAGVFSSLIRQDTNFLEAYNFRARCYFNLGRYRDCLPDLVRIAGQTPDSGTVYNIRGACYIYLGEKDRGCEDFIRSMQAGNKDGRENYSKFCGPR